MSGYGVNFSFKFYYYFYYYYYYYYYYYCFFYRAHNDTSFCNRSGLPKKVA